METPKAEKNKTSSSLEVLFLGLCHDVMHKTDLHNELSKFLFILYKIHDILLLKKNTFSKLASLLFFLLETSRVVSTQIASSYQKCTDKAGEANNSQQLTIAQRCGGGITTTERNNDGCPMLAKIFGMP